ncbi:DUF5681 domain-containing protein [Vreelandella subglaciescola]|jgi:hypothetical protein|uniref:DUF5681 domain-containing protein n=1 Tax=Vreelandella subglaciescola TaxID=29571 RepID=A0A1M7FKT5_9GAMM|nr:DUF5681 domain-containing protein [Halomonas subglaciescola]SHM04590.1 hypothetical protein SAMN05878437_0944 [Halomonas subglaciescola]
MAFEKGRSGNPAGRPKGVKDRRTEWREALNKHGNELVAKAVELALEGDAQALKLCIDRAIPAYRPAAEPVAFKLTGDTLTQKAESVLAAVAAGTLDPQTGKALMDSIAGFAKLAEIDEIRQRLDTLEERQ